MAEVIRTKPRVRHHDSNARDGGMGFLLGIILLIVIAFLFLFLYYGIPYMRI